MQTGPVLPPERPCHASKTNGKRETGRRRHGLEVTPPTQRVPRVPGRCSSHATPTPLAIIHSSALHYALSSSLFSWLKPQVKNKTMFLLKIWLLKKSLFYYFLSFEKYLQVDGARRGRRRGSDAVSWLPASAHQAIMVNGPLVAFVLLPFLYLMPPFISPLGKAMGLHARVPCEFSARNQVSVNRDAAERLRLMKLCQSWLAGKSEGFSLFFFFSLKLILCHLSPLLSAAQTSR